MGNRDMIATAGFTYKTRRLKPGEAFQASDRDARVLLAIKKAREGRVPGKVAAPPAAVREKIEASAAPEPAAAPDEAFTGFLDRPVTAIQPELADLSAGDLAKYLAAEKTGKSRKTLIDAIEAEIDSRDE